MWFYRLVRNKDKKMVGYHQFGGKVLMLNDLDLVKQVFVKDFNHFVDRWPRSLKFDTERLNNMMFFAPGDDAWTQMRHAGSPAFTSGKLKHMSKIINKVACDLIDYLDKISVTGEEVSAKEVASRFTVQSIASTGFGIEANTFDDNPQGSQFYSMARRMVEGEVSLRMLLKNLLVFSAPSFANIFNMKLEGIDKGAVEYFENIIKQQIKLRKNKTKKRNDMIDLLTEALMGHASNDEEVKRQIEEELEVAKPAKVTAIKEEMLEDALISNLILLFLAGYDTSSNMMAACMFFLAKNHDIQAQLFQEINDADFNEKMDYNTIMNLPYLDMVVYESMRHFPIVEIQRVCTQDYKIPGSNCTIPKGMTVIAPAAGIMMDERYYPNPTKFNPEHFSPENKEKRSPYAFLAFGHGPRNCIGNRLGLLQFKSGIAHIIQNFKIMESPRTPEKLEMDPKKQATDIKDGPWVKFQRRGIHGRRLSRQGSVQAS